MWENLKSVVNEVIKPNDNREITGEKHNSTLRTVINSLGKYAQFAGLAFKNTNPGTPDGPVFYFAAFKGVYINFNRIEVEDNEVAILNYNNNKWEKIVIGYSPIAPATIEDIRLTTLIDSINESNAFKTNFEFKQDAIADIQMPFLHATVSHVDADGQLIKGVPTSEVLIPVPLAEASTDADTPGKHGFMSYQDKDLLYSIPSYTISGKKISENPILTYDDIQGVAYLGEDGKIPSSLLPSYVDDVLEYDSIDDFPLIGEGGKIYLDKKTNLAYRWSGTVYVSISSSIALGETSSTAYAGDKGKKNAEDIAALKANKADKTSVYTKEEVDYLIEHFKLPDHIKAITFSVDGILVSKNEDGNLVIGGNVIVEGGISMYGPGQFGDTIMDYIVVDGTSIKIIDGKLTVDPDFVGGGTVKGIKVNGYTYDEVDANGYITIPDYPTELAWNSITGKPSTFTPSAHTHKIEDITDIVDASVSHAKTADKLKNEIKIWGQPFDGSTDVEGAISNVDVINMANADTVISLYIKDGVLRIDGDLAVTGGITMYASDGVKSGMIDQVYAVLDKSIFSVVNDVITITGEIGGGTVKAVKIGSTQYNPDTNGIIALPEYPTATTAEWDNILNKPSSFIPSAHTHAISEITNLQATLDGKAAASHTHTVADISNLSSASVNYASSAGNADTLDGNHASSFSLSGHTHSYLPLSGGILTGTLTTVTMGTGEYNQGIRINRTETGQWATLLIGKSGTATSGTGTPTAGDGAWLIGTPASSNSLVFNLNDADEAVGLCLKGHGVSDMKWNDNTVLHAGNYSSYCAPASHTHSYSSLTNIPARLSQYIDYALEDGNGFGRLNADSPFKTMVNSSHNDCMLITTAYSYAWMGEIALDYRSNNIAYRNKNDGTWNSWAMMLNTANYNSYVPTLTGGGASGTWGISVTGNAATATALSSVIANDKLPERLREVSTAYSGRDANTIPSNGFYYCTSNINGLNDGNVLQIAYSNSSWRHQLLFKFSGTTGTGTGYDGKDLWTRMYNASSSTWTDWYRILTSGNYSSYALPLSGGTMNNGARISHGGNLYIGRSDNSGWIGCQDICSMNSLGDTYWSLRIDGTMHVQKAYINAELLFGWQEAHIGHNSSYSDPWSGINVDFKFGGRIACTGFWANGNILAAGGITMYSDLRKKNILSDEVLSVKEIALAPLFAHTYKSDENHYLHIGTSAQYWSGIHEDWFTRKDGEGYYQMELQNLGVAMGISLAREIVKYESKTDKKIRLMKKKINDLEARIKELEGSREERRTA